MDSHETPQDDFELEVNVHLLAQARVREHQVALDSHNYLDPPSSLVA